MDYFDIPERMQPVAKAATSHIELCRVNLAIEFHKAMLRTNRQHNGFHAAFAKDAVAHADALLLELGFTREQITGEI
jgi:hypothetical protein